jgi:hypothetical protein
MVPFFFFLYLLISSYIGFSVILMDIQYYDKYRISVIGCQNGSVKMTIVDGMRFVITNGRCTNVV